MFATSGRRTRRLTTIARIGAIAACAAAAQPVRAQQAAAPVLTLGELYSGVDRANPRISAAVALARAAEARVPGAGRPADPTLQLGLMNRLLPGLGPMPVTGMTQLQLMQMVPTAGKLGFARTVEAARAAAAGARAADVRWALRAEAAAAFYDLYATDRGLEVGRGTLLLLNDIAGIAAAMYRVSEGPQADVLRAQVEVARMTEDTLRMHAMRDMTAARLNALLDRAADAGVATPALPPFPADIPASGWFAAAAGTRPMLRAGEEEVRAAGAAEALARREIVPDLQVGIQFGQQGSAMGTDRMVSLMVGASLPVFAGDRQFRMRDEADAMRAMAAADLAAMRADTRGRIGVALADLQRARRLAALYHGTILPQAEAGAQSALAAYRVGQVTLMATLDARMIVNRYRQELLALEGEEGKAWAELEMLTGRELVDPSAVRSGPPRNDR